MIFYMEIKCKNLFFSETKPHRYQDQRNGALSSKQEKRKLHGAMGKLESIFKTNYCLNDMEIPAIILKK